MLLAHHVLAYVEMLERDIERLQDCYNRLDVMPLGSGACVGSGMPIDREFLKKELGFSRLTQNSVDAVSDRDFIVEFLSSLSIIAMHFSRLAEELIIWSSTEFDFIELADEFCTGSSMMPQKKNPDALELIRGKTGGVYGALMSILSVMKGLPLAYNRDMQEDKRGMFFAIIEIRSCLHLLHGLIPGIKIKKQNCQQAAKKGFTYATDMSDYLVKKGCSFRETHHIVGKIIAHCVEKNKDVMDLSLLELKKYSSLFEKDIFNAIKIENCVKAKNIIGGTAPGQVKKQIARWKKTIV